MREEQEKRLRTAERKLAQLGRINPMALEEYAALEERHAYLVEQVVDIEKTRRDLLDIVAEVDARVKAGETGLRRGVRGHAVQFERVFARLFPGGQGRLTLTDPDDMRDSSQLIVITHQKRTMDVADALYGVSMRAMG